MALQTAQNPFIEAFEKRTFQTRDEAVPFDRLKLEHYIPALDYGIEKARKNIERIKNNSSPANFENTILALETASEDYEVVQSVYFNLFSAEASEELQSLAKDISPKAAAFASEVSLDEKLFNRIKEVHGKNFVTSAPWIDNWKFTGPVMLSTNGAPQPGSPAWRPVSA